MKLLTNITKSFHLFITHNKNKQIKQIKNDILYILNAEIRIPLGQMFLHEYPKINSTILSIPQENILSDVCIINLRTYNYENFK